MIRRILSGLAIAATLVGCGTAVYSNPIIIRVIDPSHRLGAAPIQVSAFDKHMGYGEDWVKKTMGVTAEGAPYTTALTTSGAAMAFDPPRPKTVEVSFAIPALESRGFFVLELAPAEWPNGEGRAWFCAYGSYSPVEGASFVPVRYRSSPDPRGWRIELDVVVR